MTIMGIKTHIEDIYGYELSAETIGTITKKVLERARESTERNILDDVHGCTILEKE